MRLELLQTLQGLRVAFLGRCEPLGQRLGFAEGLSVFLASLHGLGLLAGQLDGHALVLGLLDRSGVECLFQDVQLFGVPFGIGTRLAKLATQLAGFRTRQGDAFYET